MGAKHNNFNSRVIRKNFPAQVITDLYYHLVNTSWPFVITLLFLYFILINFLFATIYYLIPNSTTSPQSFINCYFFSVHTFSTVGYGSISPTGVLSNIVVVCEVFLGLVSAAIMTGIFFAKFSLPTPKISFTEKILITNFQGKRTLMFRLANARNNEIIDAKIWLTFLYPAITEEGIPFANLIDLKLARNHSPFLRLSFTVRHIIDETSPLYSKSFDELEKNFAEFFVTISGTDGTLDQNIHATHNYTTKDLVYERQFVDMIKRHENGDRELDYALFNHLKE